MMEFESEMAPQDDEFFQVLASIESIDNMDLQLSVIILLNNF